MIRIAARFTLGLVLCGVLASARAEDRPAKTIIDEIKAIKRPTTLQEFQKGNEKKAALIAELQKVDPENDQLPKLLPERWMALANMDKTDEALAEIDKVLPTTKNDALKKEGTFAKAQILAATDRPGAADSAEEFVKLAPKDARAAMLLMMVAQGLDEADAKRTTLEDKILKDYDNTTSAAMVKADRGRRDSLGKPFELEFTEATSGKSISMKDLKGKVVVVDFWATWCGPCIAEMPTMKKLYKEYKDQGVEFIGVSLDNANGGLDKLKDYVAKNEVTWPQYFQGNGWQSEFSKKWGVNSIPCVFIVDADGNLASVKARGKLEKMIPDLLKKGKTAPTGE